MVGMVTMTGGSYMSPFYHHFITILSPFWCLNPLKNHHVLPFKHPIYSWISHEKTYIYRRFSMIFLFQLNFSSANSTKFPKTQARSFRRHLAGLRWRWNHGVESDDGRRSRHSALNLRKFRMDLYMRYMIIYPSLYIYSVSYIIYIYYKWLRMIVSLDCQWLWLMTTSCKMKWSLNDTYNNPSKYHHMRVQQTSCFVSLSKEWLES